MRKLWSVLLFLCLGYCNPAVVTPQDQSPRSNLPIQVLYNQKPLNFGLNFVEIQVKVKNHTVHYQALVSEGIRPKIYSLTRFCESYRVQILKGDRMLKVFGKAYHIDGYFEPKKDEFTVLVMRGNRFELSKVVLDKDIRAIKAIFDITADLFSQKNSADPDIRNRLILDDDERKHLLINFNRRYWWKTEREERRQKQIEMQNVA